MEGYAGAVILATNFRQNIDGAFVRRLDFVIDFPFPEAEDRKLIWRLLLPEEAPLGDDWTSTSSFSRHSSSSPAARSATAHWPPRSRRPTRGSRSPCAT